MKKVLVSILLLASFISPTTANAAKFDITKVQETLLNCFDKKTKSVACTTALKTVKAWKPTKTSSPFIINQNIMLKCLYSTQAVILTPTCQDAARANVNYFSDKANVAQTKTDVARISTALKNGIATGSLIVSDNSGKTALTGMISSDSGTEPVGNAIVYVINNDDVGNFCVSLSSGSVTYKVQGFTGGPKVGSACKSVKG